MIIRVAMLVDGLYVTGITSVVKRYCKYIVSNKVKITLLAGAPINEKCKEEIKRYGIEVVTLPSRKKETIKFYRMLRKVLRNNKFDIFHVHGNSVNLTVELLIAKRAGIKHRIFHSHNTVCNNPIVHKLLLPIFKRACTNGFACGELAGNWILGDGMFTVIPNGFEVENFKFTSEKRKKIRKQLGIENKLVIGHVGRINYQKNQDYLLEIFDEATKQRSDAVLFIVGDGPDAERIKAKAKGNKNIIFYGTTEDTVAVYSAMDVFVFPSRFEGLPVVLLEAQMTGLPCIVSDIVTKEVDFGGIKWHSINNAPCTWVSDIISANVSEPEREKYFDNHRNQIMQYDIRINAIDLVEKYQEIVSE